MTQLKQIEKSEMKCIIRKLQTKFNNFMFFFLIRTVHTIKLPLHLITKIRNRNDHDIHSCRDKKIIHAVNKN